MPDRQKILERGYVLYSDFGAKGNGEDDDFEAIFASHAFANENSLPVRADEGMTYYIHHFDKSTIIKTDTDFTGAKFILDDTGSDAFVNRSRPLFYVDRDTPSKVYKGDQIAANFGNIAFKAGDSVIEALRGKLDVKCFIHFTNDNHRDYVRFGCNVDSGFPRADYLLVNPDGSIDPSTPITFDFDTVTKMEVFRTDDKPITIQGGYFETICCRVVKETDFENKWRGYLRKFQIGRTNTTMRDITHRITGEPDIPNEGYGRSEDGKLRQSYPYYGFFYFCNTYNSCAVNCALNAHTTYYEDKQTSSEPVPQGTYDLVIEYSSHVRCEGITNGVDTCDTRYWGIMSSNGAKNMTFKNCSMSRFDAHRGFFNANLIDCEFGTEISVVGGGTLYIKNTTRLAGKSFLTLRGDYGATFNGDIIIKNCTMKGKFGYRGIKTDARIGDALYMIYSGFHYYEEPYIEWDFGYTRYMPRHILIDNLKSESPDITYLYNDLSDAPFKNEGRYVITEDIVYKNMTPLRTCQSESCTKLLSIPVKQQ